VIPARGERGVFVAQSGVQIQRLETTERLHLNHGPIDLIFDLQGKAHAMAKAEQVAARLFESVLTDLMAEITALRTPYEQLYACPARQPKGAIARRMLAALSGYEACFVTPMAAVAGAVADHMLGALKASQGLERIVINNGGDMAFWLSDAARLRIGIADGEGLDALRGFPARLMLDGHSANQLQLGGVATSGWQGRSHSFGIADSVTVLAESAARADVAATLIANAVTLPHSSKIERRPANELSPDSDLGARPVTISVGQLTDAEKKQALRAGCLKAQQILEQGGAKGIFLSVQGESAALGSDLAQLTDRADHIGTDHNGKAPNILNEGKLEGERA
jgi:ApbE superfamily uncharacterized protein (UPF0280 family)